jgi:hypothetical protein
MQYTFGRVVGNDIDMSAIEAEHYPRGVHVLSAEGVAYEAKPIWYMDRFQMPQVRWIQLSAMQVKKGSIQVKERSSAGLSQLSCLPPLACACSSLCRTPL